MSDVRAAIAAHVREHPGVHFNALVRDLDLAAGQTQYHVRRLLRADVVVAESAYGRTHYFLPEYDEWERGVVALARRETARDVLYHLLAADEATPAAVAEGAGVARSTLEHHLSHLVERDVVEKHRGAGRRVTLSLTRPEATAWLLDEIEPSAPERFVDRFERLLDDLLE